MTVKDDRISQARRAGRPRARPDGGMSQAEAARGGDALELRDGPPAGTPSDPDELRVAGMQALIARLVATQASGRIGYWAVFSDERGVSHYAFTTDPAYADLSLENAASRSGAIAAIDRAIERYRAALPSGRVAVERKETPSE